jgi:leukotriene-A4 hydrolase
MPISDPHSFSDTAQGRIKHIRFDLDLDFGTRTIRGKADYELEGVVAGPLFLDVRDVEVRSVKADGRALAWRIDERDAIRGQRLHIDNSNGSSVLSIEFETSPKATALGWLDAAHTAGGKHPFLLSQCQSLHARSIFPCQDTPSVRFTYEAVVRVPAPMTAAMSADRTSIEAAGAVNICRFSMPQAIPSYLFALAAGNLAFRTLGKRSGVFAEPEVLDAAAWEFAETEKLIDATEKLFGPYQWETFNILILPPAFPYGGMENPRLVFLTPTLIVGDRSMVNVVAHELAHSWTGNLVTNATWEDFWLNEGWTVYAERRLLEVLEGEAYAQLHGAVRREAMLEDMRIFGMDAPPTRLKFSQKGMDPDDVFSMVPYEKGCSLLSLIEHKVGRERFDVFIRRYIETFKFRSLTTEDFLQFLVSELPEVEHHIDLRLWVYGPGFPDDALVPSSPLLDDVYGRLNDYRLGQLPERAQVAGWKPQQVEVFLKNLPRKIPADHCAYFEKLFGLTESRNRNLLTEFYVVAIGSGCERIIEPVEALVSSVGRMLYLKPLYRTLVETPWSRSLARPLFDRHKRSYHPIAVGVIERILSSAGV